MASVDENGLVTPIKAGTVTILVSYSGILADDASLTITPSLQITGDISGSAFAVRKTDGTSYYLGSKR